MGRRKKKLVEEVTITGIADKGKAVGRDESGKVLFVEQVAPGDVVDILVLRKKKGFMEGVVTNYHKLSEERTEPFCQHYNVCGGCRWQHITYEAQLKYKQQVVEDALKRIGKINYGEFIPILGADPNTEYRNKVEFTFSNRRWLTKEELGQDISNQEDVLGFHRPGAWDKIVNIERCHLHEKGSNELRNFIKEESIRQGLSFFDLKAQEGYLRQIFLRVTTLGDLMLIVSVYYEDKDQREQLLDAILKQFPQITSLYYCINPKKNDFVLDLDMHLYHGQEHIREQLGDVVFRIGPKSFFQTNSRQAELLYELIAEFCEFKGDENVYDLYTGIGSIALFVSKYCQQVVGVEEVEMAIKDANLNMQFNEIGNCIFYAGDVKNILTLQFAEKHGKPDLVITDPPRAGMHQRVVETLLELEAPRMVYVSCNPATMARDLNLLSEKYVLEKVRPVDMFPHTHHIECVTLLKLKSEFSNI